MVSEPDRARRFLSLAFARLRDTTRSRLPAGADHVPDQGNRGSNLIEPWKIEAAESLREQAASWRRLAARAPTSAGSTALWGLAKQFDEEARRTDPASEQR